MKKILIADDSRGIRDMIKRVLERRGGYHIRISTTVIDTRDVYEGFEPDILVIDDLGGGGVAFGDEAAKKIPVINISIKPGRRSFHLPKRAEEGYVDELMAKIEQLLRETSE